MRYLLICFFIVLLLLPLGGWVTGFDYEMDENRTRVDRPAISLEGVFARDFNKKFDDYFNDNFALRGSFIFMKNWLDYYVFHTSPSPKIHIGKEGWLFYRDYLARDYKKAACYEKPYMEQMFLSLHALENILKSANKKFILTLAPYKSTIYKEYVGFAPSENNCGKSMYDLFIDQQTAHPLQGFVKLDDVLLKAKAEEQIYFKTDSHWNPQGAEIATKYLLKEIPVKVTKGHDYEYYETAFYGDVGKMVGLPIHERARLIRDSVENQEMLSTRTPEFLISMSADPSMHDLPSAAFYRDSFGAWMLPYLKNSFRNLDAFLTLYIPSTYLGNRTSYEDYRLYDIVILQAMERGLKNIRVDLRRVVESLGSDVHFENTKKIDLDSVAPASKIHVKKLENSLVIQSIDIGSRLKMSSLPASDNNVFRMLKLSIEAPNPDYMHIYYASGNHPYYEKPNQQIILKRGLQHVYIPLPFWETITMLINPGTRFGIFKLHSAEIIEFPQ